MQVVQQILFGLFFMLRAHASFSDIAGKLSEQQQQDKPGDDDDQNKRLAAGNP